MKLLLIKIIFFSILTYVPFKIKKNGSKTIKMSKNIWKEVFHCVSATPECWLTPNCWSTPVKNIIVSKNVWKISSVSTSIWEEHLKAGGPHYFIFSFVHFFFFFSPFVTEKDVKTLKKMNSTRKWCMKHPFTGWNTQHIYLYFSYTLFLFSFLSISF